MVATSGFQVVCEACGASFWCADDEYMPGAVLCADCLIPPDLDDDLPNLETCPECGVGYLIGVDLVYRCDCCGATYDVRPSEALKPAYWADHVYTPLTADDWARLYQMNGGVD